MSQNKLTGDMEIKDSNDATILTLKINDGTGTIERNPE
jgi:DNA/RNA endonuclease YhcR with UshA esterase domain